MWTRDGKTCSNWVSKVTCLAAKPLKFEGFYSRFRWSQENGGSRENEEDLENADLRFFFNIRE